MKDTNKSILSAADISKELGMGLPFVYKELKAGRIPSVKVGDRYFLSRQAFEAWLSAGVPNATTK